MYGNSWIALLRTKQSIINSLACHLFKYKLSQDCEIAAIYWSYPMADSFSCISPRLAWRPSPLNWLEWLFVEPDRPPTRLTSCYVIWTPHSPVCCLFTCSQYTASLQVSDNRGPERYAFPVLSVALSTCNNSQFVFVSRETCPVQNESVLIDRFFYKTNTLLMGGLSDYLGLDRVNSSFISLKRRCWSDFCCSMWDSGSMRGSRRSLIWKPDRLMCI
jgi:hypothetical protein